MARKFKQRAYEHNICIQILPRQQKAWLPVSPYLLDPSWDVVTVNVASSTALANKFFDITRSFRNVLCESLSDTFSLVRELVTWPSWQSLVTRCFNSNSKANEVRVNISPRESSHRAETWFLILSRGSPWTMAHGLVFSTTPLWSITTMQKKKEAIASCWCTSGRRQGLPFFLAWTRIFRSWWPSTLRGWGRSTRNLMKFASSYLYN